MKNFFNFFLLFILTLNFIYAQCNQEIISYDNGKYTGCVNYEGEKHGKGILTLNLDTQIQIQDGVFENDNFVEGTFTIQFSSGDTRITTYLNYQSKTIELDIYEWKSGDLNKTFYSDGEKVKEILTGENGDKMETFYSDGEKVKEILTSENGDKMETFYSKGEKVKEIERNGPGNLQGLITTKIYNQNSNPITITNIENNRDPGDIIGENEFSDIKLIERDNQYRINIGFPTKDGNVINVPIQFDSGATSFFIGNRLYKDLVSKCEVEDMNVQMMSGGVGSEFETKYIRIKSIQIGDYTLKNVIAVVPLREDINDLLIGIGFLKKFKEVLWSLNSNLLRFYK